MIVFVFPELADKKEKEDENRRSKTDEKKPSAYQ
jgi:hypothetical protein